MCVRPLPLGAKLKITWLTIRVSKGWPSFRDAEVVWENVRCLQNGEAVLTPCPRRHIPAHQHA